MTSERARRRARGLAGGEASTFSAVMQMWALGSARFVGKVLLIVIGLMGGVKGELNLGLLLGKRASVHGSVLRSRSAEEKAALTRSFTDEMLTKFTTGELKPIVDAVLPMAEIQEAHRRMDANETFGKLVLTW